MITSGQSRVRENPPRLARATGCRRAAGAGQGRRRVGSGLGPGHEQPARGDHDDRDDRQAAAHRSVPAADPRDRDVEAVRRSVRHAAAVRPAANVRHRACLRTGRSRDATASVSQRPEV